MRKKTFYYLKLLFFTPILLCTNLAVAQKTAPIGFCQQLRQLKAENLIKKYTICGEKREEQGEYLVAIANFQRAAQFIEKKLPTQPLLLAEAYNNIGTAFNKHTGYKEAIDYYRLALLIFEQKYGKESFENAKFYNNIGTAYMNDGRFEEALKNCNHALNLRIAKWGEEHPKVAIILENIGIIYKKDKKFEASLATFNRVLSIKQKTNMKPDDIQRTFLNIGMTNFESGNYRAARPFFERVLQFRLQQTEPNKLKIAQSYEYLAQVDFKTKNYTSALRNINMSLEKMKFLPENLSKTSQGAISQLLPMLETKAKIFIAQYQNFKDLTYLKAADETSDQVLTLLESIRGSMESAESKEQAWVSNYDAFESAVDIQWEKFLRYGDNKYLEKAFSIAERGKSVALLEAIVSARAELSANIPAAIQRQESELRNGINTLEEQSEALQKQPSTEATTVQLASLETSLSQQRQRSNQFIKSLEKEYPSYFQAKYSDQKESVVAVQQQLLAENQTLIEYFVSGEYLFAFVIDKHQFSVHRLPAVADLEIQIKKLLSNIRTFPQIIKESNTETTLRHKKEFITNSFGLYKVLLEPFAGLLREQVTIITDKFLGFLPFDVLLVQPVEDYTTTWAKLPYLINKHTISYNFSTKMMSEFLVKKNASHPENFIGFAPSFDNTKDTTSKKIQLSNLNANIEEVKSIQKIVGGKIFVKNNASLSNFIANITNSSVLHLASHAKAKNELNDNSYIAFKNEISHDIELMSIKKLYSLKMNPDLVVLSACETGVGDFVSGEGIISIARGFLYAGAKSTVTTLWKISDVKSADLMLLFYKNLLLGIPKDAALTKSKREYMSQNEKKMYSSHPFFWAGFVPIGDMSRLPFPNGTSKYPMSLVGFLILSAVTATFYSIFKLKKRNSLN